MMAVIPDSPLNAVPHKTFRRRRQLEQDIDHITQEMYRRNRELADTNQALSLLRSIDAMVLESQDSLTVISSRIAHAITSATDHPFIAILVRPASGTNSLDLYGWSARGRKLSDGIFGSKAIPRLHLRDDAWLSSASANRLLPLHEVSLKTIEELFDCSEAVAKLIRKSLPFKSLYCVKLIARGKLVGVMVAGYYVDAHEVTLKGLEMLDRLGETVGIALDNRILFEENQHVLLQIKRSNIKLRALDETKDDFISMASHQLRTPLTSVKGYLSLVLDGDAGDITDSQKQLLNQAFISSQRMVYLISDLLNVSRLKTGKFIIQPSTVNLADVISDEIEQLTETAASRSIKMHYNKPAKFPDLEMDETKMRQVVMNFMDNALYYTPNGGDVTLSLKDKGSAIELKVIDTGIGVPKAEQHHLFTKFYRAGNARKARPDGTGLGLFMAKKVITAQGGSIIFDSKEGKGSTFGFALSKNKLASIAKQATIV